MTDYNRTFSTVILDEEGKAESTMSGNEEVMRTLDACCTSESLLSGESDQCSRDTVIITDTDDDDDDDDPINNERDSNYHTSQDNWDALSTICLRRETTRRLSDSTLDLSDRENSEYQASNGHGSSDIRQDSSIVTPMSIESYNAPDSQSSVVGNDRDFQLSFITRRWLLTTAHTPRIVNGSSRRTSTSSISEITLPEESTAPTRRRRRVNWISQNRRNGHAEIVLATAVFVSTLNLFTCLAIFVFYISGL